MALKRIGIGMLVFAIALLAGQASAQDQPAISKPADRVSYGMGIDIVRKMKELGMEVNVDLVAKGMKDELSGKKPLISDRELRRTMTMLEVELKKRERIRNASPVTAEANLKKGEAFLAENRGKEGVVTLPSGLQYKILKEGSGRKPTDADTVELRYRGTLMDGTEFEKSGEGKSSTFEVATTIPGLKEALKLMPVGSTWQLFISPKLAYGLEGSGRFIGPNTLLIYELELVGIK
jgi:FKBP-type peptidyl-prolyl cis-trans isomerase